MLLKSTNKVWVRDFRTKPCRNNKKIYNFHRKKLRKHYKMDYQDSITPSWRQEPEILAPYEPDVDLLAKLFIEKYLVFILRVFLCILIVVNNAVLIIVICLFKRLQTRANLIILNFAAINTSYTITSVLVNLFVYLLHLEMFYIQILSVYLLLTSSILALFLGVDWFVFATFTNFFTKYQKIFKWVLAACYVLPLIIIPFYLAGFRNPEVRDWSIVTMHFIGFIIIATINIVKYCRNYTEKSLQCEYILTLSNIYFTMWIPCVFIAAIHLFFPHFMLLDNTIVSLVLHFLILIAFVAPVPMTFKLIRQDKNFKISFDARFRKCVRSHEYEEKMINGEVHDDFYYKFQSSLQKYPKRFTLCVDFSGTAVPISMKFFALCSGNCCAHSVLFRIKLIQ